MILWMNIEYDLVDELNICIGGCNIMDEDLI